LVEVLICHFQTQRVQFTLNKTRYLICCLWRFCQLVEVLICRFQTQRVQFTLNKTRYLTCCLWRFCQLVEVQICLVQIHRVNNTHNNTSYLILSPLPPPPELTGVALTRQKSAQCKRNYTSFLIRKMSLVFLRKIRKQLKYVETVETSTAKGGRGDIIHV
jgi:hypothetical protein